MKNLKIYEKFTAQEDCERIERWCNHLFKEGKSNPIEFKIHYDNTVDIFGDILFSRSHLNSIPVKFGKVDGNFDIGENNIDILENWQNTAPKYVKGYFDCSHNKLTTLKGSPEYVGKAYYCNNNCLTDVYGFSETFHNEGELYIYNNPVYDIINIIPINYQVRFIKLLNDYHVIRNGNTIIQDRLEEALIGMGFREEVIDITISNIKTKHYKLI